MVAFPLLAAIAWKVRPTTRGVLVVLMGSLEAVLTVLFLIGLVHPMYAARRSLRRSGPRQGRSRPRQVATTVAARASRWSLDHGGPSVARGPCRTSLRPFPEDAPRLFLDVLGLVEVDGPAPGSTELGHHLAVHDGVGPALVGHTALGGDGGGEVLRPGPERERDDRRGQRSWSGPSNASSVLRITDARTSATNAASSSSSSGLPLTMHLRGDRPRDGSGRPAGRARSARSVDGPRPRGRPRP